MKTSPADELDDPLATEDESSRRALTLLWLAESAPLTAAPPDALANIKASLSADLTPAARRRPGRVLAWSGWAAAACLTVLLWQRPAPSLPDTRPVVNIPPVPPAPYSAPTAAPVAPALEAGTVQPFSDPADLRRQLTELRAALAASHQQTPGTHRPVIRELRPPNAPASAASQDRILDLIATALESDLNRRSPSRDNSREVVIESGWANWASALPADATFRHRQFPVTRWEELGLLRSPAGQFFDPATGWLWSPDPGSTDYTGQVAPPDLNRALFAAAALPVEKQTLAAPSGYLITATGGETIVALSGLPSIPANAALFMTAFGTNGNAIRYGVNNPAASASDGWNFSGLIPAGTGADFERGFSLEVQGNNGSTVLLSTGGTRP